MISWGHCINTAPDTGRYGFFKIQLTLWLVVWVDRGDLWSGGHDGQLKIFCKLWWVDDEIACFTVH